MNLKFKFQNYAPIFEIFQNYTHAAISPHHKGLAATLYICCVIPPGAKGLAAKPYDGQPLNTITNNRMNLCVTDPNKGGSFYEKTFEQKSSRHSVWRKGLTVIGFGGQPLALFFYFITVSVFFAPAHYVSHPKILNFRM
jgi:hypothetical protein